jgi:hypothetical protein
MTISLLKELENQLVIIQHSFSKDYEKGWLDAIRNVKYQIKVLKEKEQ